MALTPEQQALDFNPDLQGIARQRKLAELLMAKGIEQPQGQMISGRYVAPSWTQQLQPLFNAVVGTSAANKADTEEAKLAEALRGKKSEENKAISEAIAGKDWNKVQQLISGSETGAGKEFMPELAKYLIPDQQKSQVVSPGGALVDASGKVIYQAPYRPLASDMGVGGGEGHFTKKGDYIAPGGIFIGKSEVTKDREGIKAINELRQTLAKISPEDVAKTDTIFGDVTQGGVKGYLAKQLGSEAVSAQSKVNAGAIMQTLQNLPPGPASDKDIMQAKSSFPGYGNGPALQEWINRTKDTLEQKINNANQKYGSESWYGAAPITAKPTGNKPAVTGGIPNGVTKAQWDVMTPEEKAAFQ